MDGYCEFCGDVPTCPVCGRGFPNHNPLHHRPADATARFWVYWLGWVKLSLRPGEELWMSDNGSTDEGYKSRTVTYVHMGAHVSREIQEDGTDCDGRHSYSASHVCPIDTLAAGYAGDGTRVPLWERVGELRRDHTAEAAGY